MLRCKVPGWSQVTGKRPIKGSLPPTKEASGKADQRIRVHSRLCGSFWQEPHATCTATWGLEGNLLYEVWMNLCSPPIISLPHPHCSWSLTLGRGREHTAWASHLPSQACSRPFLTLECSTTIPKVSCFFSLVVWVSRVGEPRDRVRRQVRQATSVVTQAGPFHLSEPLAFRERVK